MTRTLIIMGTVSKAVIQLTLSRKELVQKVLVVAGDPLTCRLGQCCDKIHSNRDNRFARDGT